jgi:hypothetical protein
MRRSGDRARAELTFYTFLRVLTTLGLPDAYNDWRMTSVRADFTKRHYNEY